MSPATNDGRVTAVVEPLCKATEQALKPPRIRDTDHLFIWTDPDDSAWFRMDLRCMSRGRETAWPGVSAAAESLFLRIPERKALDREEFGRRNLYRVAATDFTVLIIHHCWPWERIHFRPPGVTAEGDWQFPEQELARSTYRYLLLRFFNQTERAARIADFKENGTAPELPGDWVERDERPLAPYQRMAATSLLGHDSLFVTADRGTGKTAIGVQDVCVLARRKRMEGRGMLRALVICPNQVRFNWRKEFGRFATVPGKATIIVGTRIKRIESLSHIITSEDDLAFSVGIIGVDTARSESTLSALLRIPWDIIIADESHKFKSPATNRWDAMERLRDVADVRVPMTGSPIGNSPMDLWSQLEFMARGMSGFLKFDAFRKFYGRYVDIGHARGVEKLVALKNVPLLQERLARCSFQITKAEAGLELPEKVEEYVEVQMTRQQAEIYDQVATRLEIEIEDKLSGDVNNVTVQSILTQLLRLAQVTSGHLTYDAIVDEDGEMRVPKRIEAICDPNPKIDAVVEMLKDPDRDSKGKTVVWCHFVPDIKAISYRLDREGIKHVVYFGGVKQENRDALVDQYNEDPETRVMICNPQTAGEGLNLLGYDWDADEPVLDTYTDHAIFFSCNWSALDRGQAEDRCHRRGMRAEVTYTDLVVPGTIDEEIRERVRGKQEMAQYVLDIRDILRAVLNVSGDREEVA